MHSHVDTLGIFGRKAAAKQAGFTFGGTGLPLCSKQRVIAASQATPPTSAPPKPLRQSADAAPLFGVLLTLEAQTHPGQVCWLLTLSFALLVEVYRSVSLPVCLSLPHSLTDSLSHALSLPRTLPPSLPPPRSLSVCVSLSLSLSLSFCIQKAKE